MVIEVLFLEEFARADEQGISFRPWNMKLRSFLGKEAIANSALSARMRRELSANSISSISLKRIGCHGGSWDWREIGAKGSTLFLLEAKK